MPAHSFLQHLLVPVASTGSGSLQLSSTLFWPCGNFSRGQVRGSMALSKPAAAQDYVDSWKVGYCVVVPVVATCHQLPARCTDQIAEFLRAAAAAHQT